MECNSEKNVIILLIEWRQEYGFHLAQLVKNLLLIVKRRHIKIFILRSYSGLMTKGFFHIGKPFHFRGFY